MKIHAATDKKIFYRRIHRNGHMGCNIKSSENPDIFLKVSLCVRDSDVRPRIAELGSGWILKIIFSLILPELANFSDGNFMFVSVCRDSYHRRYDKSQKTQLYSHGTMSNLHVESWNAGWHGREMVACHSKFWNSLLQEIIFHIAYLIWERKDKYPT